MINVAIFGNNDIGSVTKSIIEVLYNKYIVQMGGEPLHVVTYIGRNREECDKQESISLSEYFKAYTAQEIPILILPIDNYVGQTRVIAELIAAGMDIEDIYCSSRIMPELLKGEGINTFIQPYLSCSYLPYLEFHVADHCNMNCKACEHYSSLVQEPHFTNYEQFEKDFQQLKSYVDDIGVIRIMGGEPLLNPELHKYVRLSRKTYPNARIYVVTNALLIKQISRELIEAMREEEVKFSISYYPPLEGKMDDKIEFIKEQGIGYTISELNHKFTKKQTLIAQSDEDTVQGFVQCLQASCHNIYEGKLAACFLPFTTKYFNQYFQKELPEDGAIDLYEDGLTIERIKIGLLTPFERCRYCTIAEEVDWGITPKPSGLEDWIVSKG